MREYELQQCVKSHGGKTLIHDSLNQYRQYRESGDEKEQQFTEVDDHEHRMVLGKWEKDASMPQCYRCGRLLEENGRPEYVSWMCEHVDHEEPVELCVICVPVVLRTPTRKIT